MAKKKDEGHEETEKVLADLEKRITKEYAQAEKELTEKLNDYLKRFEKKDEIKRKAMEEGKISEEDYAQWRLGQIAIGERWKDMRDTMAKDMANASQMAKDITNAAMPEVYAINHNYGTFQVEKAAKMDTSYTMYDKNTAKRLFDDSNTFYKGPGKKLTKAINEGKQVAWDKKQIQSIMTQALLQGKPIGAIATDLCNKVGDSDRKAAIRNARTMTTGIQNAGRIDSYKRAEDMGIDLMQEWMATLDDRTRHEHRVLDGQRVKVGDKFKVEGYEIEYPGDPSAEPEMVYNCRCTLVPVLKGFEVDSTDLTLRNDNHMKEETYEEWKESHDIVSHSITKQDELAEMFKESYIQDYKYLAGQNPYIPSDPDYVPEITPEKAAEKEEQHTEHMEDYNKIKSTLEANNVSYLEVNELSEPLTSEQIIEKLAGGDKTKGSCASLAMAYCANMNGLDVTDFKGGISQETFSRKSNILNAVSVASNEVTVYNTKKEATEVAKILKGLEQDREYFLFAGQHATIVKNTVDGLQYLEMQSQDKSGWHFFEEERMTRYGMEKSSVVETLRQRFGCLKDASKHVALVDGELKFGRECGLAPVDSFKNTVEFKDMLGYINTETDKQKKGVGGNVK